MNFNNFLRGMIEWKLNHNEDQLDIQIRLALEQYTLNIESCNFSHYFDLATHNPRFVVMIANEYLKHAPSEPLNDCIIFTNI